MMKMQRNAQFANSTLNRDLWFREVYRLKTCIYKMLCGPDHKIMTAKSGIPMEFTYSGLHCGRKHISLYH